MRYTTGLAWVPVRRSGVVAAGLLLAACSSSATHARSLDGGVAPVDATSPGKTTADATKSGHLPDSSRTSTASSTGPIVTESAAPSRAEIPVGGSINLAVTVTPVPGMPADAPPLTSSNPAIATLANGLVFGVTPGTTLIQYATAAGPITVSTIAVVAPGTAIDATTPASLSATPALISIPLGGVGKITAQAYSLSGAPVPATPTFVTGSPNVVSVDASGDVAAVGSGFAVVEVSVPASPDAGGGVPLTAEVVVEVLTASGGEPVGASGGCGDQPFAVACQFQHPAYALLVGAMSQMEPASLTYACPFAAGFTTSGAWSGTLPVTGSGLVGPVPSCGASTVSLQAEGLTCGYGAPQAAPAQIYAQPDWKGDWTCASSSATLTTAQEFTGVQLDARELCPIGDPNCCGFASTNANTIGVGPDGGPESCVASSDSSLAVTPGASDVNGFACTLSTVGENLASPGATSCVVGRKYACVAGTRVDAAMSSSSSSSQSQSTSSSASSSSAISSSVMSTTSPSSTAASSSHSSAMLCVNSCATNEDCSASCPVEPGAISCCDTTTNKCFSSAETECPGPRDAGAADGSMY